jgi:RNA polymerase sigma-70 factor (ECF subfamily)
MHPGGTSTVTHDRTEEFVRLMSQNQPRIFAFVLAILPNFADAEEVVQETSLVLWRRFAEFQPGTNFHAWACSIARYKVLEFRRANPRRGQLEMSESLVEQIAEAALHQADALEQRRQALYRCLNKLAPRDRDLIERRLRDNATVPEISRQIGRPVAGLYKAFERIYRALHECIDRQLTPEARS